MDPRELRAKFAQKETKLIQSQFMAPYAEGVRFAHVKIDSVVYRFRIVGCKGNGFGIFKPIDGTCARFVRNADETDAQNYLKILPKLHFVLSYETDKGWVGYPMNMEVARKTIGLDSEVVIKNVTDCERFDIIVARFDSVHFWFGEPFVGADLVKSAKMRDCFRKDWTPQRMKKELETISGVTQEERVAFDLAVRSWKEFQVVSTESRIKQVFEESGAKLGSYVLRGANIEVRWTSERGRTYTSLVKGDTLDVISAGICLDPHDGTGPRDNLFHLRDLPYVMKEGETRGQIVERHVGQRIDDEDEEYD